MTRLAALWRALTGRWRENALLDDPWHAYVAGGGYVPPARTVRLPGGTSMWPPGAVADGVTDAAAAINAYVAQPEPPASVVDGPAGVTFGLDGVRGLDGVTFDPDGHPGPAHDDTHKAVADAHRPIRERYTVRCTACPWWEHGLYPHVTQPAEFLANAHAEHVRIETIRYVAEQAKAAEAAEAAPPEPTTWWVPVHIGAYGDDTGRVETWCVAAPDRDSATREALDVARETFPGRPLHVHRADVTAADPVWEPRPQRIRGEDVHHSYDREPTP